MATIILLAVMVSTLGGIVWTIGRHIPVVVIAPEFVVNQVARQESVARKLVRIAVEQYKTLLVILVTRAIHRLKVISLKTDNIATKLLQKIRSYEDRRGN